ncbi:MULTISPECIES: hypothetical protein [Paraliobacillus]|uniref:hypothetical protein n=1 Tax=Paraliobacillus TaxID=200903 RepID=UPI000DD3A7EE|nr:MULTISPECIES: hypothetical protein [Paraliobacillus]
MNETEILQNKMLEWNKQSEAYLKKIEKELEQLNNMVLPTTDNGLIAYYTYSFNITYREAEENLIIGNLHVQNRTNEMVNNLSICLLIQTTDSYQFSGKYTTVNSGPQSKSDAVYWKRIDMDEEEGAYWFTLMENKTLAPSETISFSDFSLAWEQGRNFSCRVNGLIYTEKEEGIAALNAINIHTEI